MQFLTDNDLKGVIGATTLTTLQGINSENLGNAEELAFSELDPLRQNYDIDGELAKSATARNAMLVRMLVHITVFYLFNTVEDVDIPDRVNTNFQNQLKTIEKIAAGKMSATLDSIVDETTELPNSKYRFGGNDARDNDIY
jgi:phage gp36-like protein